MPEIGQPAVDFTLPRDGGGTVTLSALRPQRVVLFFYPKDDTSGCTLEATAFTALSAEFAALDCTVLGISRDSVASHDRFRDKHRLAVPLLSDADGTVCEAYGAWAEKVNYGRRYWGIVRTTVLIDGTGRVEKIWRNVRAKGHAEAVLDEVRKRAAG